MTSPSGPRIFGIVANETPVVAVIRRGPSSWCATGRWDVAAGVYEPGTWIHGTVYPQRCDLSPDGRWLSAFVLKQSADWAAGSAYVSLSRLPWLTALAAWGIGSTWTNGVHFLPEPGLWLTSEADVGDPTPCRERYGLAWTGAASFAVERRRGWSEAAATPPRDPDVQWADWSLDGRLLVATSDGRLQVRDETAADVTWEHDLAEETPHPTPPPPEASVW